MKPLYLASGSPRRYELLQLLEYPFEVLRVAVPEQQEADENAHQYVMRLARQKAEAGVQALNNEPGIVLGADTIIVVDGDVMEKPQDKAHFLAMFERLSGRTHQVMTAVCAATAGNQVIDQVTTEVSFCHISQQQAEQYWSTGEPLDKAGGYGIQGRAGKFVQQIKGSYFAVVGLPLYETEQLIQRIQSE
ncbi:Maf family protein [Aliidiomarina sp. Khilg15.8]